MSFGLNTEINNNESSCINYDFIYLSVNKKIVKLLLHNNDDLKSYEIFSDKIHYILNGGKKNQRQKLIYRFLLRQIEINIKGKRK